MATVYKTVSATTLGLSTPIGIAVNPDLGHVLICDSGNNRLTRTEVGGFKLIDRTTSYDGNNFNTPAGAFYHDGYYYVVATTNHTLVRFRARDMEYKDHFGTDGTSGSSTSLLYSPSDACTDGTYIYITDSGNNRIMKLVLSTLAYSAQTSNINGTFSSPHGICFHKEADGALYISDATNNRVIKCKTDFTYIEQNSTGVASPRKLIWYKGHIHVADCTNDRITVLKANGLAAADTLSDSTVVINAPQGIASYRDSVFITDADNGITAWRAYNPRDSFTSASKAKFGSKYYDNPLIIIDQDTVTVGTTQESGTVNRWKEENSNMRELGWTGETALDTSAWSEE